MLDRLSVLITDLMYPKSILHRNPIEHGCAKKNILTCAPEKVMSIYIPEAFKIQFQNQSKLSNEKVSTQAFLAWLVHFLLEIMKFTFIGSLLTDITRF